MKFVIDEDLPRSISAMLHDLGHEPLDIRDYGLRGMPDERIFEFAQEQKAVLMTADLGFANILSFPPGTHCGIIVLRFPNEIPTSEMVAIAARFLKKIPSDSFSGNLVIITPARARLRRHM
ncbi:MAG: DUF5615 family PIN-like protein [Patescibacteria group bacterium]